MFMNKIKWKTENTTLSEHLQIPIEKSDRSKIDIPSTQMHDHAH